MVFWWQRRKKWWRGRRRPFYKRKYKTNKRRRRFRRPKRRRTYRRRRRTRKTKVRRKQQKIKIAQWQPEKIVKCKIKGLELFLLGAEGKQFACFTTDRDDWVPARNPGGGGFAVDRYTLQSLYSDFVLGKNVWTKSNLMLELCRYTGARIKFFRHQYTDFVVNYSLQPPFDLQKDTYMNTHPYNLLLRKHSKIIPSRKTKPSGKRTVTIRIKPPKTMTTTWYFQETFAKATLFQLNIAACNLNYAYLPPTGTNQLISLLCINTQFYQRGSWGNASRPYNPIGTMQTTLTVQTDPYDITKKKTVTIKQDTYLDSINIKTGWFQTDLLRAYAISEQNVIPITAVRYNPTIDTGKGNSIWLKSTIVDNYDKPSKDKDLIITDKPLWMLLYGFLNFVQQIKKDPTFLRSYVLLLESPFVTYISHLTHEKFLPIDKSFIDGKGPFNEPATHYQRQHFFPTLEHQQQAINAIVESGPYIPKYSNERESNWELTGLYTFYFKWGGTQNPDEPVADPATQGTYITPDNLKQAVQIVNPSKQVPASILHCWDYRRGLIKKSALQRIIENQETDTDFQTDAGSQAPPQKKKRYNRQLQYMPEEEEEVQESLLNLCKESIFQETQDPQQLYNLIQQQQQQQQQLKLNLLNLISNLKKKQRMLQLQTGLLE
nr:MAG: ORF1 [Torque teno midi virus]